MAFLVLSFIAFFKGILKLLGFVVISHQTSPKNIEVSSSFKRTVEGNVLFTVVVYRFVINVENFYGEYCERVELYVS